MESIFEKLRDTEQDKFRTLIGLSDCCDRIEKEFLSGMKFHINVITAAARGKLKETAHSLILHDLLHHKTILGSFLETIVGVPADSFTVDNIDYPDHDRIDLSFRSKDRFLIIENKVNGAQEQPGQIYRYRDIARSKHYNDNQIIILYLNPSGYETPSLYSRSQNGNSEDDAVPKEKITVKDFNHDIIKWLKKLTDNNSEIFEDEPFLESALCQYLDYLEEKFQTKNEYKKLHDMTENEIKQELGLTDSLPIEEQISILEDQKAQLQALIASMDRIIPKLIIQLWQKLISDAVTALQDQFNGEVSFYVRDLKIPEGGFDVEHEGFRFHVSIVYWTNNTPYWRIFSKNEMSQSTKKALADLLPSKFDDVKQDMTPDWPFYKITSMENAKLRLTQLASMFINSPDFKVIK